MHVKKGKERKARGSNVHAFSVKPREMWEGGGKETHQLYVVPRSIPMTVPTSSGSLAKPVAASARSAVRSTAADTRIVAVQNHRERKSVCVCM
jgi:hypothetical protein